MYMDTCKKKRCLQSGIKQTTAVAKTTARKNRTRTL